MNKIKYKILLVLLLLLPIPYSCIDESACLELNMPPYYRMMGLTFGSIQLYHINPISEKPLFDRISQEYETFVYPSDSLALYIMVPDTMLQFHAHNPLRKRFSLTQDVLACETNRPGFKGTLEMLERIHITSNFDYDEMHPAGSDLRDIVDIFVYAQDDEVGGFWSLRDYNENLLPQPAPKRLYLLLTRNARLSPQQQFVIRYHLMGQAGRDPREFRVVTPVINVKIR